MKNAFHPFLFAIYPVLFLYSQNTAEFSPSVMVSPAVGLLGFTFVACLTIRYLSNNRLRSAALLSLFIFLFFSYGHVYSLLEQSNLTADPKIALYVYIAVFLLAVILFWTRIHDWQRATNFLNRFAIVLVLLPLLSIGVLFFRASGNGPETKMPTPAQAAGDLPDIFYIILDGYPRKDVLQKIHGYDNSEFLLSLKQRGFRVLESSRSNYSGTAVSLASSLNFTYLHDLLSEKDIRSENQWILKNLIEQNRLMAVLRKEGYATAAFDSGYLTTEIKDVDYFFATGWFLNEFHEALLDTTPLWVIFKNIGRYEQQRRRILYTLDHLSDVKDPDRPVFVFAHIMALHSPFVFGPNGEKVEEQGSSIQFWREFGKPSPLEVSRKYQDQLTFINKKVGHAVDGILRGRMRPVCIILQGDHGSSFMPVENEPVFYFERFSILNAILLPEKIQFDDSLTPVNTFRVILNQLFQTGFPLLPDRSFYSTRDRPFNWKEVTSMLNESL